MSHEGVRELPSDEDEKNDDPGPADVAMGQNAAQDAMDHLKRLAKAGRPYPLQAYKEKRTWPEKREFVAKLSVDKMLHGLKWKNQSSLAIKIRRRLHQGSCIFGMLLVWKACNTKARMRIKQRY